MKIYMKNVLVFLVFIAFLSLIVFLLSLVFSRVDFAISEPISF